MPRLMRSGTPRMRISLVRRARRKNTTRRARRLRVLRVHEVAGKLPPANGTSTISILTSVSLASGESTRRRCGKHQAQSCPWACGSAPPSDSSCRRADRRAPPQRGVDRSNFSAWPRTLSATLTQASNHAPSSSGALSFSMRPILCSSADFEPPWRCAQHVDEPRRPAVVAEKVHNARGLSCQP